MFDFAKQNRRRKGVWPQAPNALFVCDSDGSEQ